MKNVLQQYASLLVNYCVSLQPGQRLFVQSTTLAEPLVREVYRESLRVGGTMEADLSFREKGRIFFAEAQGDQLKHISPLYEHAINEFEAYIYIRAPFNLRENQNDDPEKVKVHKAATKAIHKTYFERTGSLALKRSLCQYPTLASAQNAGMSLEEYENFVYGACSLFDENPMQAWLDRRKWQQQIVDLLNTREKIRYLSDGVDISFSTKGRKWINSDGQTNMPSGEVYTSPVEDSVNGVIHFSFPGLYMGREVEGVTLYVEEGYIEKWEAKRGKAFLDEIFGIPGARRFGEAAVGTNYNIKQLTRNILFDEKIGGTVHMAIGQSYLQCGGKNESSIHWDMITDMTHNGGAIYADDEKIYENGKFLFLEGDTGS